MQISFPEQVKEMEQKRVEWLPRYDVMGVGVDGATYSGALEAVSKAVEAGVPACVTHLPVHGLVIGSEESEFRSVLDAFQIVAPDGQPVKLALNLIHNLNLPDRCYGPEFMLRVCDRMALMGAGVYLYGSYPHVVDSLRANLLSRFHGLKIAGSESPPFRPLTSQEDEEVVKRINSSGAGVVFIGLGCPLQEKFAYEHRHKIRAVQICVGAAFDFHAGNKKMAPPWMQKASLEWLFRLFQEPRRLWRRYLYTNGVFLWKILPQVLQRIRRRLPNGG